MTYMLFRVAGEQDPELGGALFAAAQAAFDAAKVNRHKCSAFARCEALLSGRETISAVR